MEDSFLLKITFYYVYLLTGTLANIEDPGEIPHFEDGRWRAYSNDLGHLLFSTIVTPGGGIV